MYSKKEEIMGKIFEMMENFISNKISGNEFDNFYTPFWKRELRDSKDDLYQKDFSKVEREILNELHSDCDCLEDEHESIRLSEEELKEVVKDKLKRLKELQKE